MNDAWLGEVEGGQRGVRLKSVQLILSKHRPPPLQEAHKQSDPQYIHRHTHNHTYMQSLLCPVWFGNSKRSLRDRGRRGGKKGLSQVVPEFMLFIQFWEILQTETSAMPPQWCWKAEAFIPPLFYITMLKSNENVLKFPMTVAALIKHM